MKMHIRTPTLSRAYRWLAIPLLMATTGAFAQKPPNVTPGEMALLPEYCPDTQGFKYGDAYFNTSPRAKHWVGLMGPSCWGLIKMRRATAAGVPKVLRDGGLKAAIGDYEYVLYHSTPDFVMLPEVYLRIGEAQLLLNDYGAASDAFAQARSKKPGYWPAYVQWAEVLVKIGKKQEALALIEECLRLTPSEPALRAPYERMGGKLDAFLRTLPAPTGPASSAASQPRP
jgi:tetratricopeptide (TPR) repeat protein